jgi:hypothetical protein
MMDRSVSMIVQRPGATSVSGHCESLVPFGRKAIDCPLTSKITHINASQIPYANNARNTHPRKID